MDSWLLDTGASQHYCAVRAMFSTYKLLTHKMTVPMANSSSSEIVGIGSIVLKMVTGSTLTLENVRHVPDLRTNVISGSQLTTRSFELEFKTDNGYEMAYPSPLKSPKWHLVSLSKLSEEKLNSI